MAYPQRMDDPAEPLPRRWSAATSRPDMWVDPGDDPRESNVEMVDERSTLLEFLRGCRVTLELKCQGLDAEQLARRSVPPSTMSLLGMLRHMARVEHHWFRRVMAGEGVPRLFSEGGVRDADWDGARPDPDLVEQAWALWRAEVAFAEQFVSETDDLGTPGQLDDGEPIPLRVVLVHMIEEYARHCGHADLLRERIDGRVGQ